MLARTLIAVLVLSPLTVPSLHAQAAGIREVSASERSLITLNTKLSVATTRTPTDFDSSPTGLTVPCLKERWYDRASSCMRRGSAADPRRGLWRHHVQPHGSLGVTIKTKDETKRDRRVGPSEEKTLLNAALTMSSAEHRWVGSAMHDRLIGALETCCRQGEMLRIQNRHVDWDLHQIAIPGAHAKDAENRRIPFDPQGRLAPILKRRAKLGPNAYVFGTESGGFQASFKTAWEALLLFANRYETKRAKPGLWVARDRARLQQIDLHWHDLRHEGACRLLADGVDIRSIQLMLGHADIKQTQRYLNITDEELRKAMTGVWERRRQLRAVAQ